MALWVDKNWKPLIKGNLSHAFCGRGYFAFLFETKEDMDLIFRSGPYFMGTRGMYFNRWTLDFNPENDIPSAVLVWVCLRYLPLHYWNDETVRVIGNTLGKYIDRTEPKEGIQACARICVEVDLEKGLPQAVQLTLDEWTYLQQVDYEQLPFKCKNCHEYGHFAKNCPKLAQEPEPQEENEQWQQPKKRRQPTKVGVQPKQGHPSSTSSPKKGKASSEPSTIMNHYDPIVVNDDVPQVEPLITPDQNPLQASSELPLIVALSPESIISFPPNPTDFLSSSSIPPIVPIEEPPILD
jgi:hypothetical protein